VTFHSKVQRDFFSAHTYFQSMVKGSWKQRAASELAAKASSRETELTTIKSVLHYH
jgi:hypothetical protein